jgi:ketosteroid isomerase-like protein
VSRNPPSGDNAPGAHIPFAHASPDMQRHASLIRAFYAAFQRRDHEAMAACYAPQAQFRDPVFTDLTGWRIATMWRMLCERATDLDVSVANVTAGAESGSAHWEARYTFTATGRPVHNVIEASFSFAGGKIQRHVDAFDLYAWARQALGLKGLLLGWAPSLQRAIRAQASCGLDAFVQKHGLGPR